MYPTIRSAQKFCMDNYTTINMEETMNNRDLFTTYTALSENEMQTIEGGGWLAMLPLIVWIAIDFVK